MDYDKARAEARKIDANYLYESIEKFCAPALYEQLIIQGLDALANVCAAAGVRVGADALERLEYPAEAIPKLIAAGAELGASGAQALKDAAEAGDLPRVQALLAAGVRVGLTGALCVAASRGHGDVCEALIEAGADVAPRDSTPMNVAASNGHVDVVDLLIKAGAKATMCHMINAASGGHADVVSRLITEGVPLWDGSTILIDDDDDVAAELAFDALEEEVVIPTYGEPYTSNRAGHIKTMCVLLNTGRHEGRAQKHVKDILAHWAKAATPEERLALAQAAARSRSEAYLRAILS